MSDERDVEGEALTELQVSLRRAQHELPSESLWRWPVSQFADSLDRTLGRRRLRGLDTDRRRPV
jgi:hypothetical protein